MLFVLLIVGGCGGVEKDVDANVEETEVEIEELSNENVELSDEDNNNSLDDEVKENKSNNESELTTDEYVEIIMAVYDTYDADIALMTSYLEQAEANKNLYNSEEWINKASESLMRISFAYELLKGISEKGIVPNGYEDFHELTKQPFSTMEITKSMFVGDGIDREILSSSYLEMIQMSIDEMVISNNELRVKINE